MSHHPGAAVLSDQAASDPPREFTLSDADFRSLAKIAYDEAGIVLTDAKRNLLYSRLSRRLRALGLDSFRDYRRRLAENAAEIEGFINAISTNLTRFFREAHHFDHFRSHVVVPFAHAAATGRPGRLRVWSAGCSTGEEPYSAAIVLLRELRDAARHDIRLLATDIDTEVLARAATGRYPASSLEEVPRSYRDAFCDRGDGSSDADVGEAARALVTFRRLNLLEPWPFTGLFDAIFCRNVMIYFDADTRHALVTRFAQQLRPGGFLYLGHSESLTQPHPGLKPIGRTVYRRQP